LLLDRVDPLDERKSLLLLHLIDDLQLLLRVYGGEDLGHLILLDGIT
jgi:hypothetical protein